MKVKIQGITRKGKNRIKEHGNIWKIIRKENNNILLKSPNGYLKWLKPDFEITE